FVSCSDPVDAGLVASLNRPGSNITGVVFTTADLAAKRLGLLHELVPKAAVIAVLLDPNAPGTPTELRGVEEARRAIIPQVVVVKAAREGEFNSAFATMVQAAAGALSVRRRAFCNTHPPPNFSLGYRHARPPTHLTPPQPE